MKYLRFTFFVYFLFFLPALSFAGDAGECSESLEAAYDSLNSPPSFLHEDVTESSQFVLELYSSWYNPPGERGNWWSVWWRFQRVKRTMRSECFRLADCLEVDCSFEKTPIQASRFFQFPITTEVEDDDGNTWEHNEGTFRFACVCESEPSPSPSLIPTPVPYNPEISVVPAVPVVTPSPSPSGSK